MWPGVIHHAPHSIMPNTFITMLKNYFRTGWRSLTRNRTYSILNIAGLAIALASCMVIFLVLQHEYSFDKFHKHASRIYQFVRKVSAPDGANFETGVPFDAVRALRNDYPQIGFAELFTSYGSQVTVMQDAGTISNKRFLEERGVFYAEPELFGIFDVHWLTGSPVVLQPENSAALCRSLAEKYFGSCQDAVGKYIKIDNIVTARVSGIIDDVPANSDFPFRLIVSYKTFLANPSIFGFSTLGGWNGTVTNHQVFALLPDRVDARQLDSSFIPFLAKYAPKEAKLGVNKHQYFLQPLANIHFDTRFENNGDHISSKASLYTLTSIGILILLMACINYINLSTALAAKRSREVGVRKVLGSSRRQLRLQVFAETGLLVLLAAGIAVFLARASLPYLKNIFVAREQLDLFNSGSILFIAVTVILTTLLSGSYPALFLSRFNPMAAIKNKMTTAQIGGISLRRALVVLQFAFSQLLVIATIVVISQMKYVSNADLGFNKEAILLLHGSNDSTFRARQTAFKTALQALPGVQSVSLNWEAPSSPDDWRSNFSFDNIPTSKDFNISLKCGDADYLKTFGLRIAAGGFYQADDTAGQVVINETLARKLGLHAPGEALGKTIRIGNGRWRQIAGVVEDFKTSSMKEAIPPTIILKQDRFYATAALKLNSNNPGRSDRNAEAVWNKYFPEYAYQSEYLDESINKFYVQERRLSSLYKVYAGLAILISCLGLYGLVSFMAVQKTREIGVRKVLGASIKDIIYLFSKEFTVLILLAFLLAAPVAWYMMNKWLGDFAYRIHIGPGVFFLAILISLAIAWLTVGYRSVRAALANPVKSLRME